jgi:hypothetical protein
MKLAVVGSRGFNDYEILKSKLDLISEKILVSLIISGGAIGADSLAEKWAKEKNIPTQIFLPDWKKYGKRAGYLRNIEIVKNADIVIAFWNGESKGTKLSIDLAKEHKKELIVITYT